MCWWYKRMRELLGICKEGPGCNVREKSQQVNPNKRHLYNFWYIHRAWNEHNVVEVSQCSFALAYCLGFHTITLERTKIASFKSSPCSPEPVGIATILSLCCTLSKKMREQTHRHTDTLTKHHNPRCACGPRVNKQLYMLVQHSLGQKGIWKSTMFQIYKNSSNTCTSTVV